jgi:hypothetical protein
MRMARAERFAIRLCGRESWQSFDDHSDRLYTTIRDPRFAVALAPDGAAMRVKLSNDLPPPDRIQEVAGVAQVGWGHSTSSPSPFVTKPCDQIQTRVRPRPGRASRATKSPAEPPDKNHLRIKSFREYNEAIGNSASYQGSQCGIAPCGQNRAMEKPLEIINSSESENLRKLARSFSLKMTKSNTVEADVARWSEYAEIRQIIWITHQLDIQLHSLGAVPK